MKFNLGFILVANLLAFIYDGHSKAIETRDAVDFGIMILRKTGRNPLIFRSYGNHCGYGGGGTPVDAIDQCCENHDNCYKEITGTACPHQLFQYPTGYNFKVEDGNITCEGGNFFSRLLGLDDCAQALCNCDKDASECFAEHISVYNDAYKGILPQILKGK